MGTVTFGQDNVHTASGAGLEALAKMLDRSRKTPSNLGRAFLETDNELRTRLLDAWLKWPEKDRTPELLKAFEWHTDDDSSLADRVRALEAFIARLGPHGTVLLNESLENAKRETSAKRRAAALADAMPRAVGEPLMLERMQHESGVWESDEELEARTKAAGEATARVYQADLDMHTDAPTLPNTIANERARAATKTAGPVVTVDFGPDRPDLNSVHTPTTFRIDRRFDGSVVIEMDFFEHGEPFSAETFSAERTKDIREGTERWAKNAEVGRPPCSHVNTKIREGVQHGPVKGTLLLTICSDCATVIAESPPEDWTFSIRSKMLERAAAALSGAHMAWDYQNGNPPSGHFHNELEALRAVLRQAADAFGDTTFYRRIAMLARAEPDLPIESVVFQASLPDRVIGPAAAMVDVADWLCNFGRVVVRAIESDSTFMPELALGTDAPAFLAKLKSYETLDAVYTQTMRAHEKRVQLWTTTLAAARTERDALRSTLYITAAEAYVHAHTSVEAIRQTLPFIVRSMRNELEALRSTVAGVYQSLGITYEVRPTTSESKLDALIAAGGTITKAG